jgi:hypothetical protein
VEESSPAAGVEVPAEELAPGLELASASLCLGREEELGSFSAPRAAGPLLPPPKRPLHLSRSVGRAGRWRGPDSTAASPPSALASPAHHPMHRLPCTSSRMVRQRQVLPCLLLRRVLRLLLMEVPSRGRAVAPAFLLMAMGGSRVRQSLRGCQIAAHLLLRGTPLPPSRPLIRLRRGPCFSSATAHLFLHHTRPLRQPLPLLPPPSASHESTTHRRGAEAELGRRGGGSSPAAARRGGPRRRPTRRPHTLPLLPGSTTVETARAEPWVRGPHVFLWARDPFVYEGDQRRRDFAVLPPGCRCRRFDAKNVLEEAIPSPGADGLSTGGDCFLHPPIMRSGAVFCLVFFFCLGCIRV